MTKSKTIVDSVRTYDEGAAIVLAVVKAMGEKWPDKMTCFVAGPESQSPPPGTWGIVMAPFSPGGGKSKESGENGQPDQV